MSVKPILLDMESMMDVIAMYKCKFCEYTSENQLEVKNHINVHLMPAENLSQLHVRAEIDKYVWHYLSAFVLF